MRLRKVAWPKSNSWLPGTKMSGAIRLVRVRMRSPRSRPDISDGDSVSPAWARITLPPFGALGLDHGGEAGETTAALPVRHHLIRHQIDVIDQDEGDACGLGAGRGGAEDRDQ